MLTPRYDKKFVLITGASRGLGRLISEYFLDRGASVIGFSRGDKSISHPNYQHFKVDISIPQSIESGFEAMKSFTSKIDIVINNAAVLTAQYSMIMPIISAHAMINTNLLGAFIIARESSKLMRKSKWGRIINISTMAVSLEPIGDSIYAASKAGMVTCMNVMAKELAPLNITCNTLAITAIETDMFRQLPLDKVKKIIQELPIPRFACEDDIFNVIDFLSSDRSSYITAQTISLGGLR